MLLAKFAKIRCTPKKLVFYSSHCTLLQLVSNSRMCSLHHTVSCIPYSQDSGCLGDCFSLFWKH